MSAILDPKRNAAGMSPEELSLQDAFMEGQRAGQHSHGREMNPYQAETPEYNEFERGRLGVIGMRLANLRR